MKKTLFFPLVALLSVSLVPSAHAQSGERVLTEMTKADANRDGVVSRKELLDYRGTRFGELDRNGDGVFTTSDLPAFGNLRERAWSRLSAFDANNDGRISRNEFVHGPTVAFDAADTNDDNLVTKAELKAAKAKVSREMGR